MNSGKMADSLSMLTELEVVKSSLASPAHTYIQVEGVRDVKGVGFSDVRDTWPGENGVGGMMGAKTPLRGEGSLHPSQCEVGGGGGGNHDDRQ